MAILKLLFLSYMPTSLYFSYYHANSIAMLYQVHKYKKKFEYGFDTFIDHDFFLAFLDRGYGCSTCHTIVPFTIGCQLRTCFGHMKIKSPLKLFMKYSCSGSIYMKRTKIKQNSVNFQN